MPLALELLDLEVLDFVPLDLCAWRLLVLRPFEPLDARELRLLEWVDARELRPPGILYTPTTAC